MMALHGGSGEEICNRLTGTFLLGISSGLNILPVDHKMLTAHMLTHLTVSLFLFYESTLSKPSYF